MFGLEADQGAEEGAVRGGLGRSCIFEPSPAASGLASVTLAWAVFGFGAAGGVQRLRRWRVLVRGVLPPAMRMTATKRRKTAPPPSMKRYGDSSWAAVNNTWVAPTPPGKRIAERMANG